MLADAGFLAAHFEYELRLSEHPDAAQGLAEALARPCVASLSRAYKQRKSRDSGHVPPAPDIIRTYLLDRENHYLAMDSGREGEPTASARFANGEHTRGWKSDHPVRFKGHVIVPYDRTLLDDQLVALRDVAAALQLVFGSISYEENFGDAHHFVLVSLPYGPLVSLQHRKERRAHWMYEHDIFTKVPGPEWGLFLGAGHLDTLPADALRGSGAFARVLELRDRLVYLQLTDDPADARDLEAFDRKLDAARAALAPIAMDLTGVTFS